MGGGGGDGEEESETFVFGDEFPKFCIGALVRVRTPFSEEPSNLQQSTFRRAFQMVVLH